MQKRISELTPAEQEARRAYNRQAKRFSREKQKAAETPTEDEWFEQFLGSPQHQDVRNYAEQQHKKISEELGIDANAWSRHPAWYEVDAVVWTLYGFKEKFVREVTEPKGIRVSGSIFPDVIGSRVVATTHRHRLEKSAAYNELYRALLKILDERFGKHLSDDPIERRAALDVKAEIAGTYALPEQEIQ
jgi:hypothetical protein